MSKENRVMNIAAIVVTYFPDAVLLARLLDALQSEVKHIYIVDNTPAAGVDWLSAQWLAGRPAVTLHPLGDNFGIARAQNVGIELAAADGCSEVILFDQDSAPSPGMIGKLAQAKARLEQDGVQVGAVGPLLFDEKYKKYVPGIRHAGMLVRKVVPVAGASAPLEVDYLIASGALMDLATLRQVGLMREELFIDWVDIEWGLRAGHRGRRHFMIPDAVMYHSIGDDFVSAGKTNINLHNDVRNYYIVRNACYLLCDRELNWRWRLSIVGKIPLYVVFYTMFSTGKSKWNSFKLLLRACLHGFTGRVGKAF